MKKILFCLICLLFILPLSGCKKDKNSPQNQTIKYNLESEPKTLDPQIANDPSSNTIIVNIFEGLTRTDENLNIIPGVAKSWDISDDGLKYTFYLRDNAYWSNKEKTPVTAHDFVFGMSRAIDSQTESPKANSFYCIKNAKAINLNKKDKSTLGVTALNDHTLLIELEYIDKNFLYYLSSPPFMPCNKEFFYSTNGQYGLESSTIIGNGAFKIKTRYGWDHFKSISLTRNENYSGEMVPIPAGVAFSIGKDMSDSLALINNGTVDSALLTTDKVNEAKNLNLPLISFKDTLWGITFNTKGSIFSDTNIRLGILKSIDREYTLSSIPNYCYLYNDIVIDNMQTSLGNFRDICGSNRCIKKSPDAKASFEKGMKDLNIKKLPSISIICLDDPTVKNIVSNIIENLNGTLNYYFNMEALPFDSLMKKAYSSNFQIAFIPITAQSNSAIEFLKIFKSDNTRNIAGLNSIEYDRLLEQAILSEPEKSMQCLISAEDYLNKNAIFYPLYTQDRYFATSKKLSGVIFYGYSFGIDFFNAKKTK